METPEDDYVCPAGDTDGIEFRPLSNLDETRVDVEPTVTVTPLRTPPAYDRTGDGAWQGRHNC